LLYLIEGINTNVQVSCEAEDLNPEQQTGCEEPINCLVYFLNIMAAAGNLHQVFCPELASISQSIPNVCL
jgi:hypothetical protein